MRSTRAVSPTNVKLIVIIAPWPSPAISRAAHSQLLSAIAADSTLPAAAVPSAIAITRRQFSPPVANAAQIELAATPSISIPARLSASGSLSASCVTNPCTSAGCTINESTPNVPSRIALITALGLFTS